MSESRRFTLIIGALLIVITLASLFTFALRNQRGFYQIPIDFLIFIRSNETFKATGQLYERAENYADKYHPSAAIYKFPPAFQLMIKPLLLLPANINAQLFMRSLLTGMYVLSLCLLFFYLKQHLQLKGEQTLVYACLLTSIGCWFMPFFESIRWLLVEIPLLLLFITSFLLSTKKGLASVLSGALLAYAACAKIYPLFLLGYPLYLALLQKNRNLLWGFVAGCLLTLAAALSVFGLGEHLFYLQHIVPTLLHEPITEKWVNLNLEKFLFVTGVIPEISGHAFTIIRLVFLSGLLAVLWLYRQTLAKHHFLVFSLFITTMFFCFPNYWPQYQVFLLVPVAYLLGSSIKNQSHTALVWLLVIVTPLFVPDLLWQSILDWDITRQGLDIEMIGKEAYLQGNNLTLLKYSPATWLFYYLYEYRALVPVALWLWQVRQIKKLAASQLT